MSGQKRVRRAAAERRETSRDRRPCRRQPRFGEAPRGPQRPAPALLCEMDGPDPVISVASRVAIAGVESELPLSTIVTRAENGKSLSRNARRRLMLDSSWVSSL